MKKWKNDKLTYGLSLFLLYFTPFQLSADALTNGLVAAYNMNASPADSSGKNHHAHTSSVLKTTNRWGQKQSAYAFNGSSSVMTIPDHDDFSVNTTGYLSMSVWVRPIGSSLNKTGELLFNKKEGSGYVHWMGKGNTYGSNGNQEWTFRIYSADNTEGRHNRMSVYHFKYSGGKGPGSYVEQSLDPNAWIHYVAVISKPERHIWWYKNGVLVDHDSFDSGEFAIPDADLRNGNAPVKIGTQDGKSFFRGDIDNLYFYNRKLREDEILQLFNDATP